MFSPQPEMGQEFPFSSFSFNIVTEIIDKKIRPNNKIKVIQNGME